MGWMRFNSSTNSSSRREVAMFTAEYEQFINQPCVSPQVFYGSRRSDAQRVGSEAFRTMEQTWESQSGGALESDDTVKTK